MCAQKMKVLTVAAVCVSLIYPVKAEAGKGGYRDITRFGDTFIATGSEGRIDHISLSGEIIRSDKFTGENFNCITSNDTIIIAAGDNGTIVISNDGLSFRTAESGTDNNINSIVLFNNMIIAGADRGEIITDDGQGRFRKICPGVRGNIVSVSAGTIGCYGVTDEGEIIHSSDGAVWKVFDFNEAYRGYYRPGHFTGVVVTDDLIAVTGFRNDGSPFLIFSSQGKVWTDRTLNYTDDMELKGTLRDMPNDIFYDRESDQFFIACNSGNLMRLSSCNQCNRMTVLTGEDLAAISGAGNILVTVGSNFFVRALNMKELKP